MRNELQQIIDGILYDTENAEIIASNEYWDGHNFERSGRNLHLYKSPKGRFFLCFSSQWQGERTYIEAISAAEAMKYYETLSEHDVSYEEAFGVSPEEA